MAPLMARLSVYMGCVMVMCLVRCPPALARSPAAGGAAPLSLQNNYPLDSTLRMNHIQFKVTHNAYHLANVITILANHAELRYSHVDLKTQLQRGVRGIELDVFLEGTVDSPSLIVYHDPEDSGTTCGTLKSCLSLIKDFSDATNGQHHYIFHHVEIKEFGSFSFANAIKAIEDVFLDVFGLSGMIQVTAVQGSHGSLRQAVRTQGWPTLGESRGKHFLTLQIDNDLEQVPAQNALFGAAVNSSRIAFQLGREVINRNSSWVVVQEFRPTEVTSRGSALNSLLLDGVLVRTRADADLEDFYASTVIPTGCHAISSDFTTKSPNACGVGQCGYLVDMPDGTPSRCNVITAPANCTVAAVETGITSRSDILQESDKHWCCEWPNMYYTVMGVAFVMFALHFLFDLGRLVLYFMPCEMCHVSAVFGPWLCDQALRVALVITTRTVLWVRVSRSGMGPDDGLTSIFYLLHRLALGYALYHLLRTLSSQLSEQAYQAVQACVGSAVLSSLLGLIISWASGDGQEYGFGSLNGSRAFLYLELLVVCVVCATLALLWSKHASLVSDASHRHAFVLVLLVLATDAPLLFVLSVFDAMGALAPLHTIMDGTAGVKVLVWHILLGSFFNVVFTWFYIRALRGDQDGGLKNVPSDVARIELSEEVR